MGEMLRRGEKAKCPACGWGLDEDAYRCPKCRIYFCYKCRARVGRREQQYQCADQSCGCYGKLLCAACTVMVSNEGPVTRPGFIIDVTAAFWTGAVLGVIAGVIAGFSGAVAGWAFGIGAVVAVAVWIAAAVMAAQTITTDQILATHRCCIQCRHSVKNL
jgi:hypothetical protein